MGRRAPDLMRQTKNADQDEAVKARKSLIKEVRVVEFASERGITSLNERMVA